MRSEDAASAAVRLRDAGEFLASARDNLGRGRFKAALDHAVDAAIAANDAFTIGFVRGVGSRGHREALDLHAQAGRKAGEERLAALATLLELRHRLSYRPVAVSRRQAEQAVAVADRFASWVRATLARG